MTFIRHYYLTLLTLLCTLTFITATSPHNLHDQHDQSPIQAQLEPSATDPIPFSTRAHWMRRAVSALTELRDSPCPVQAFGTVIVNHTGHASGELGELICIGVNRNEQTGNPTLHGEISAINNCSYIMSQPPHNMSPSEIRTAFQSYSLYTTAEACPMCASAIRWSGFREYIYSTSIERLLELNWGQFDIGSEEVFSRSEKLGTKTRLIGGVIANETDGLFTWQFADGSCPAGCARMEGWCERER